MPKIHLKPHSAEFAEDGRAQAKLRVCDIPGCPAEGLYKAPKNRGLEDHYWFCIDHVQEYNKGWDFFSGMSPDEIETHIIRSALWDRPTKRYDGYATLEENLHRKAWQTYNFAEKEPPKPGPGQYATGVDRNTPEFKAMALLELSPPLDMKTLKARYKALAKKHHPDLNGGDPASEELLKSINLAYTVLKISFEKFEKLAER